ncbi:hypothetical protein T230_06880 [Tannerella sp. oral taxon BU063 isolate Cell 1/3]|uniref:Uncharacterized protein n=1 Tax=Tannerella sp. oral taxon BU063 isolate Cell 1/3 TaxID=1411022 RepID=W2CN75_9BACT|nr:hypothetical protein T230_06880 [Tannerella sp. oral taxon BU063 isolate Cell 1/3]
MEIDRTLSTPAIGRRLGGVRRLFGGVSEGCKEIVGLTVGVDPLVYD